MVLSLVLDGIIVVTFDVTILDISVNIIVICKF